MQLRAGRIALLAMRHGEKLDSKKPSKKRMAKTGGIVNAKARPTTS